MASRIHIDLAIKLESHSITKIQETQHNRDNHRVSPSRSTFDARRFIAEPRKLGREDASPGGTLMTARRFLCRNL